MAKDVWYSIHLCKDGKEFKVLGNVLDNGDRPMTAGRVIGDNDDKKWRIRGAISNSVTDLFVDVEPA